MMADELKPCPFCRASGENLGLLCDPAEGSDNSGPSRRVQCYGCNIEAPFYDSADEAIAAWNDRPAPKVDSALVGELRDQVETEDECCQFGGDGFGGGNIFREAADEIERLAALSDRDVVLEEAAKAESREQLHERAVKAINDLIDWDDMNVSLFEGQGEGVPQGAVDWLRQGQAAKAALKGGVDE